ncbi:hypothetical protein Leryth_010143, partial [Lithospermum erythrorhizon]
WIFSISQSRQLDFANVLNLQAGKYKTNIARFSGVAWNDNEEKQKVKLKEKFDKCVRGKLLEFCNILDIPGVKTTSKKEDIVTKLIEFLEAPHATRDQLIAEKGKKRKRVGKKGSSASKSSSSKKSTKVFIFLDVSFVDR